MDQQTEQMTETAKPKRQRAYGERAPVEKWKLTPELLEIERAFRQPEKLKDMIKTGIIMERERLNVMTDVLHKVQKQQDAMLEMIPPERGEVDGTPMHDADFQINY